jgi:hypothetical protein
MCCQRACPENADLLDWVEPVARFTLGETEMLLEGVEREDLPRETLAKLEKSDLINLLEVIPRNLGLLLDRERGGRTRA